MRNHQKARILKSGMVLLMAGILAVQGTFPALAAGDGNRLINDLGSHGRSGKTEQQESLPAGGGQETAAVPSSAESDRDWGEDIAFIAGRAWLDGLDDETAAAAHDDFEEAAARSAVSRLLLNPPKGIAKESASLISHILSEAQIPEDGISFEGTLSGELKSLAEDGRDL